MDRSLAGKKIAILITDGFEEVEMTAPRRALESAGARTCLVSPRDGKVQGMRRDKIGVAFPVEVPLSRADPEQYDALLLPGGIANPDALRINKYAVEFVKAIADAGKPIAAICHGAWTLIEAGVVKGRRVTSWPSLQTDLENAGATWVNQQVCVDRGLVTSRNPSDIPAFNEKMLEEFRAPTRRRPNPV